MWVLRGPHLAWERELFWASTCVLRNNSRCDCNRSELVLYCRLLILLLERSKWEKVVGWIIPLARPGIQLRWTLSLTKCNVIRTDREDGQNCSNSSQIKQNRCHRRSSVVRLFLIHLGNHCCCWVDPGVIRMLMLCVSESAIDLMQPIKQPQTLVTQASGGWYSVCQIAGLIHALIICSINRTTSQSLFCFLCICLYCSNNCWRAVFHGCSAAKLPSLTLCLSLFITLLLLLLLLLGPALLWWRVKEHVV